MLSRRAFLIGTGASGAGLAAGAASAAAASPQGTVERFVRAACPAEGLSDAEVARFAKDFLERSTLSPARRRVVLFLMENRWAQALAPEAVRARQARQERHLVTRFLLSTDAFDADRAPGPPRYWGYADPYESGCANPVARFDGLPE